MKAILSSIFCIWFILLAGSSAVAAPIPGEIIYCDGVNRSDYITLKGHRPIKASYQISFEQSLNSSSDFTTVLVEFDELKSSTPIRYHDLSKTLLDGLPVAIELKLLGSDDSVLQSELLDLKLTENTGKKKIKHSLRSTYAECGIELRKSVMDWEIFENQMQSRFDNLSMMENCLTVFDDFESSSSLLTQINGNKIDQQVQLFEEMKVALNDFPTVDKSDLVKLRSGSNYPSIVLLNQEYKKTVTSLYEAYMEKGYSINSNNQLAARYFDAAAKLPYEKSVQALEASFERQLLLGKTQRALEILELLDKRNFARTQDYADRLFDFYREDILHVLHDGSLDRARKMARDAEQEFCSVNVLFKCNERFDELLYEVEHYAYELKFAEFSAYVDRAVGFAEQHKFDRAIREIDAAMDFAHVNRSWNIDTRIAMDALVHIYCVEVEDLHYFYDRLSLNERWEFLTELANLESQMIERGIDVEGTNCHSGFLRLSDFVYEDMLNEANRLSASGNLDASIDLIIRLENICRNGFLPCDERIKIARLKTEEVRYFGLLDLANHKASQSLFSDAAKNFQQAAFICEKYAEIECQTNNYQVWVDAELRLAEVLSQRNELGKSFAHIDRAYRILNNDHPVGEEELHRNLLHLAQSHLNERLREMRTDLQKCLAEDDSKCSSRILKSMERLHSRYGNESAQSDQIVEETRILLQSKNCLDEQEYINELIREAQYLANRGDFLVAEDMVLEILNTAVSSDDCRVDFSDAELLYESIQDVVYYLKENELLLVAAQDYWASADYEDFKMRFNENQYFFQQKQLADRFGTTALKWHQFAIETENLNLKKAIVLDLYESRKNVLAREILQAISNAEERGQWLGSGKRDHKQFWSEIAHSLAVRDARSGEFSNFKKGRDSHQLNGTKCYRSFKKAYKKAFRTID